jgi:[ribosomal protein S5]-alanine N-acetyltransferase
MRLRLKDCDVRSWTHDDAEAIVRHANSRHVSASLRDGFPSPYTLADARSFLDAMVGRVPETAFAIAVSEEAVGNVALIIRDDPAAAEIVCWLGEAWWRHGIATQATQAVTEWAWDALRLTRVYALVFEWNAPSIRVLQKAGYALEGRLARHTLKDGQLMDRLVYAAVRLP